MRGCVGPTATWWLSLEAVVAGHCKARPPSRRKGRPQHLFFLKAKQTEDVYSVHMVICLLKICKIFLYFFFFLKGVTIRLHINWAPQN